jgi:endoglycosylceramidase
LKFHFGFIKAGDIYQNPFRFLPGIADRDNLLPLYDRVHAKIRAIDPETLIFYEPVTWGIMSTSGTFGTGFTHPPGNDAKGTILSWHYYCWVLQNGEDPIKNDTVMEFYRVFCDKWQINEYFDTVEKDTKRLGGGPSFLSEFGVCVYIDPITHDRNIDECKPALIISDSRLTSWTYWDSNFYDFKRHVDYLIVNEFSRVYPTATNGIPLSLFYNSTTRFFSYSFDWNTSSKNQASLTTDIFIPQHLYPNGFNVTVSSNLQWTFDQTSSKLILSLQNSLLDNFDNLSSLITSTVSSITVKSK